jgi:hypothetical protein
MEERLSIKEAAALVNRSTDTIYRWRAGGCAVSSRQALLEYAEHQDLRSRGAARILAFDRPSPVVNNGPGFPGDTSRVLAALDTLESLKTAFKRRLKKAQEIGDELESEMLSEELGYLTESHRLLDVVCEAYEV